ncbi:hypothetical protein VP1G_10825 [Cytospora mali]|uniref:PD-(D/E)XK nuclease-like domain-containing protein n=1 Tax=Cytospora mali TaxID=578113 RepID=A0A194UYD3_CYTMA|nr:hypothetical protein VP1G_10825 [Valsa mali var. pyri (nom. inval.)]
MFSCPESELHKLHEICTEAAESVELERYEDAWNILIHQPLLKLALEEEQEEEDESQGQKHHHSGALNSTREDPPAQAGRWKLRLSVRPCLLRYEE